MNMPLEQQSTSLRFRTHVICFAASIVIYGLIVLAATHLGLLSNSTPSIIESDQLPSTSVEGELYFSPGHRYSSAGILVQQKGKASVFIQCWGVKPERHPNAIPCHSDGFSPYNGKIGRVWYKPLTTQSRVYGEIEKKLAVQLLVYPDRMYSFEAEKNFILAEQEGMKHNLMSIFLTFIIHAGGVIAVLLAAWFVAGRLQKRG